MSLARRRRSIKDFPDDGWKTKLRDTCLLNLQQKREKVLERAREAKNGGFGLADRASITNDLTEIIQASIADEQRGGTGVTSCSGFEPAGGNRLTENDFVELMNVLEEELIQGKEEDEVEYLDSLEDKMMEDMLETHFGCSVLDSSLEMYGVLCPICMQNWLVEWHGVIICPEKHLRLDTSYEGMGLEALKQRLKALQQAHASCTGMPFFYQRDDGDASCLVCECRDCGMMEVVL